MSPHPSEPVPAPWLRVPRRAPAALGNKPLLLLDVDGPLNPYPPHPLLSLLRDRITGPASADAPDPVGFEEHVVASHGRDDMAGIDTVTVRLARVHGERLRELSTTFDLVWCTFWEYAANHSISPLLGLGDLHAVTFPTEAIYAARHTGSWKTKHLLEWLAREVPGPVPWVWVDDEVDDRDQALADSAGRGEPSKVLPVDPYVGLGEADFAAIADFGEEATVWMRSR